MKKRVDFIGNAILDYFRSHTGQTIIMNDIAESVGVHLHTVQRKIRQFRAEGVLKVVGNKKYEVVQN